MSRRRKKKAPEFTVQRVIPETDADGDRVVAEGVFTDVFTLLLELHSEAGIAPLDRDRAARNAYLTMLEGKTLVVRNRAGTVIGTLGLRDVKFWYSDLALLHDVWLVIDPEFRKGAACRALLRAATEIAEETGQVLVITVTNPDQQGRKARSRMARFAEEVGYVPRSYSIRVR